MCLTVSQAKTDKLLKKPQRFVVRYKAVDRRGSIYCSPIFSGFVWKEGWNEARGSMLGGPKFRLPDGALVSKGAIHVFLRQTDAEKWNELYPDINTHVIPVKCYLEDLIGVGQDNQGNPTEAYTKVFVERLKKG